MADMGRRIAAQDEFRIVEVDPGVVAQRQKDGAYGKAINRMLAAAGDGGKTFEFLPPGGRVIKADTMAKCLNVRIRQMGLKPRVHVMRRGMHVYVKVDPR